MDIFVELYNWLVANIGTINDLAVQTADLIFKWYVLLVTLAEILDRFLAKPGLKKALPSPFKK